MCPHTAFPRPLTPRRGVVPQRGTKTGLTFSRSHALEFQRSSRQVPHIFCVYVSKRVNETGKRVNWCGFIGKFAKTGGVNGGHCILSRMRD